jgi:predicted acylesterase/phospholipase RssA
MAQNGDFMHRTATLAALVIVLLASEACEVVSNRALFNTMCEPEKGPAPPLRPATATRISRLVRGVAVDSYYEPKTVAGYLRTLKKEEGSGGKRPLSRLYECLGARSYKVRRGELRSKVDCYSDFFDAVFTEFGDPTGYRLQAPPGRSQESDRDLIRLASNLGSAGADLLVLADQLGCLDPDSRACAGGFDELLCATDLAVGISEGLEDAAKTIETRRWHREKDTTKPKTALVMSGGAADGAYIAGFVWSLLAAYQGAPGQPNLDLVVGTSTGALIGATVDKFFTQPERNRQEARDKLICSYTRSYQKDMLCIVPGSGALGMFKGSVMGLVRFDPAQRIVEDLISKDSISNNTEFVTMTVDTTQGTLWADSDQDSQPVTKDDRVRDVMASVVEPALAEPQRYRRPGENIEGIHIDGGVRSGLPLVEAARRGAERVVVLSASSLDPPPVAPRKNGGQLLLRSIDLFVDQLRDAEAQQAEGQVIARRVAERELCFKRYEKCRMKKEFPCGKPAPCIAKSDPDYKILGSAATWTRGRPVDEVKDVWQSMWVFRGEKAGGSATGYEIHPVQMGKLFESGVVEFRKRCCETLDVLGFSLDDVSEQCSAERLDNIAADAKKRMAPPENGWLKKPPPPDNCKPRGTLGAALMRE